MPTTIKVHRGGDPLDPNDGLLTEGCGCGTGGSSGSLVLFSLLLGLSWGVGVSAARGCSRKRPQAGEEEASARRADGAA